MTTLAFILMLGGCDGGISGTGIPPIDTTGPTTPSGTVETGDGQAPSSDLQPRPLVNAVAVRGQGTEIRIVNAGAVAVALDSGPDADRVIGRVSALARTPGTGALVADGQPRPGAPAALPSAPLRLVTLDDGAPLAVFEPLALVPGSVTTLVVGPGGFDAGAVIALPTRIEPPDPALSMLRVVSTVALEANAEGSAPLSLSGTEADQPLDPISAAEPATDYLVLSPGEYILRVSSDPTATYSLSLTAGEVATAYLVTPLPGGDAPRLQLLMDSEP